MKTIYTTQIYDEWFAKLRDREGKARINARLRRIEQGNFGDFKSLGNGVLELRFDFGPGYRVYLAQRGTEVIVLLAGGDKSTQQKDINIAHDLARQL